MTSADTQDTVRAAIAATFVTWAALLVVSLALPMSWVVLEVPSVLAAPLLGVVTAQLGRKGGGR
ncbi:hypothetical protein DZF91_11265 [Actinomadura logoneensis]|uniref:Uncharacterized protein n=1 Tax=Actinomadura logoneensis TaxID=2293572 RepID=A0A372JQD5_9ACTN|nr:hypothetical protein [Actinomadura logoneensis]RFU41548.1 hypothetical protein DZF91_11265 [Actinomadura logoneensis]